MCLACDTIEQELAEQEQLVAQVKLHTLQQAALPVDPVTPDDDRQRQ
jgi:hypothetical protein